MSCQQIQNSLSLYLYGELDFAAEEVLEQHLSQCAFCQQALAREKAWHTSINTGRRDFSLDLLAECRRDLKGLMAAERTHRQASIPRWRRWRQGFSFSFSDWSARAALASFLVLLGFGAGRWMERSGISSMERSGVAGFAPAGAISEAGLLGQSTRVRDVRPAGWTHTRHCRSGE